MKLPLPKASPITCAKLPIIIKNLELKFPNVILDWMSEHLNFNLALSLILYLVFISLSESQVLLLGS